MLNFSFTWNFLLSLYASHHHTLYKISLQERVQDQDRHHGNEDLGAFYRPVRDQVDQLIVERPGRQACRVDDDRIQIALQRILVRLVHVDDPVKPRVPVIDNGFSLCFGRNREFQIDQAGAVFLNLTADFIFTACIPVVVGFYRCLFFQVILLFFQKIIDIFQPLSRTNSDIWDVVSGKSTLSSIYNMISLYSVNVSAMVLLSLPYVIFL